MEAPWLVGALFGVDVEEALVALADRDDAKDRFAVAEAVARA